MTLRVVLDTNVLVSAFITPGGIPGKIRDAGDRGEFILISSEAMMAELADVLTHPRLRKSAKFTDKQAAEFMEWIGFAAVVIRGPAEAPPVLEADPDDDWILATAVHGGASVIVTGDKALLALASHTGIPIITPSAFLAELHGFNPLA